MSGWGPAPAGAAVCQYSLLPGEPCLMKAIYGRGAQRRREERKIVMQVTMQVTISYASSAHASSARAYVILSLMLNGSSLSRSGKG